MFFRKIGSGENWKQSGFPRPRGARSHDEEVEILKGADHRCIAAGRQSQASGRYVPTDRRVGGPRSTVEGELRGLGCELATQAKAAGQTTKAACL